MICTTIQNRKLEKIFDAMDNDMSIEMAEIRLDRCSLSLDDIDELFSQSRLPLVATCRTTEGVPAKTAEARGGHSEDSHDCPKRGRCAQGHEPL